MRTRGIRENMHLFKLVCQMVRCKALFPLSGFLFEISVPRRQRGGLFSVSYAYAYVTYHTIHT
jgi:hypothetical protein